MTTPPDTPIRIAYLINQYPAVSHSFIRREIGALERAGFAVTRIALQGWRNPLADAQDTAERDPTWYVQRQGLARLAGALARTAWSSPRRLLGAAMLALRMARRAGRGAHVHLFYLLEACAVAVHLRRSPVLHLHAHFGTNSADVAMLACRLGGIPYSFTVHGPEEFDRAAALGLVEKVRNSAFVVAISSFGRGQLLRWIDAADWPKVKIVHCGLEPGFYAGADAPFPACPRFVCVGRLCEQKGQLLLLQAAGELARDGREFGLTLAGDGPMRAQIEREIVAQGLETRIRLTGWLSAAAVREEILGATALVLPSLAEGLPVVLMEAMALGRPVLSTYVAGIPELVQDGRNGWLFPSGSVEHIVAAMRRCLDTAPAELERMGAAARLAALARHDIGREAGKLARHIGHPGSVV